MSWIECHLRSRALDLNTSVNVILPEGIQANEKLKVLYLLHGYIGDHTDWMRYSSIERYAEKYRLAIVMPSVNNSYYTDMVYGMPYFTYVSEELTHWITRVFPVSKKGSDHFIAGLSMGGYGAFKIAFSKPEYFAKAVSLSGALDIERIRLLSSGNHRDAQFEATFGKQPITGTASDLKHLVNKIQKKNKSMPELFLACGTEDFLYEDTQSFMKYLDVHHIHYHFEPSKGEHNWAYWDRMIIRVLDWLFQKK